MVRDLAVVGEFRLPRAPHCSGATPHRGMNHVPVPGTPAPHSRKTAPAAGINKRRAPPFLGCIFDDGMEESLRRRGALIFLRVGRNPFYPYRGQLYPQPELSAGPPGSLNEDPGRRCIPTEHPAVVAIGDALDELTDSGVCRCMVGCGSHTAGYHASLPEGRGDRRLLAGADGDDRRRRRKSHGSCQHGART